MASNNSTAPSTSTPEYDPDMLARLLKNRRVRTMVDGQDGTPDDEALTAALQGLTIIDDKEHPELANSMKETMQLIMDMTHGDQDFNPEKLQEIQTKMAETFSSQLEKLSPEEQKQLEPLQSMLSPNGTAQMMNTPISFVPELTGNAEVDASNAEMKKALDQTLTQITSMLGLDPATSDSSLTMNDLFKEMQSETFFESMHNKTVLEQALIDDIPEKDFKPILLSADKVSPASFAAIQTALDPILKLQEIQDDEENFFQQLADAKSAYQNTLFSIDTDEEDDGNFLANHILSLSAGVFVHICAVLHFSNNSEKFLEQAQKAEITPFQYGKTVLTQAHSLSQMLQHKTDTHALAEANLDVD